MKKCYVCDTLTEKEGLSIPKTGIKLCVRCSKWQIKFIKLSRGVFIKGCAMRRREEKMRIRGEKIRRDYAKEL